MAGIAWVLGAGFSRALGGPLLPALLSRQAHARLRATYPDEHRLLDSSGPTIVRELLSAHGWERSDKESHAWQDAEEFLEHLDLAAESPRNSPSRRLLQALSSRSEDLPFDEVAAGAKRLVAAECAAFLRDANTKAEKWKPYVTWAGELQREDTVITFNYDRVVEVALAAANREARLAGVESPMPRVGPLLIKLHGSIDWKLREEGGFSVVEPEYAIGCSDHRLAIASPGPTKARLAEGWGRLWAAAAEAITGAKAVVFVGYRFPPSDAVARERLLGAIRGMKEAHVSIHTVLGPNTGLPESVRLLGLLRYALIRGGRGEFAGGHLPSQSPPSLFTLRGQPLYGEDFIGLVERASIIDPHMDERRR